MGMTGFVEESKQLAIAAAMWEVDCIFPSNPVLLVTIISQWLSWSPRAALTKHYKLGSLERQIFIVSTVLEARSLKGWKGCAPSEGAGEDLF